MNKFKVQQICLMSMNKVMALALVGAVLIVGCGTDGNKKGDAQKVDTIVSKVDSSMKVEAPLQDTAKKKVYVAPEISEEAMQRAVVSKRDSSFQVYNNIRADYRIIGYQSADTNSKKMILFSVFTSDVKDNPFQCPYGSYYGSPHPDELTIKYTGELGSFIKADINRGGVKRATVYFEKKWVEFQD